MEYWFSSFWSRNKISINKLIIINNLYIYSTTTSSQHSDSRQLAEPSHWDSLNSPLIQDEGDGKSLKLRFDVSQYTPEEIVVKTVDNKLLVRFYSSSYNIIKKNHFLFILIIPTILYFVLTCLVHIIDTKIKYATLYIHSNFFTILIIVNMHSRFTPNTRRSQRRSPCTENTTVNSFCLRELILRLSNRRYPEMASWLWRRRCRSLRSQTGTSLFRNIEAVVESFLDSSYSILLLIIIYYNLL